MPVKEQLCTQSEMKLSFALDCVASLKLIE